MMGRDGPWKRRPAKRKIAVIRLLRKGLWAVGKKVEREQTRYP